MSFIAASVIAGGATLAAAGIGAAGASGMFGGGGGGSAGGGGMSAKARRQMNQYIRATEGDANRLITQVGSIATNLKNEVAGLGASYAETASAEEKKAIDRINNANEILQTKADATSETFSADIQKAIEDLAYGTEVLNLGSREDTMAVLDGFKTEIEGLEATALERADAANLTAKTETADLTSKLQTDTASLGDTFLQQSKDAQDTYRRTLDEAMSTSPEKLAEFTRAADFFSQAAVDTRAKMLATADPRALELAAIADENAAAMMSGRISADMQANLSRSSAMRALQGGFGASGQMGRGLAARDLGLTSLDLQQRGMKDYEAQRRLNYDTRVSGLQTDASALRRDDLVLRERQGANLLDAQVKTFDRNFANRSDALGLGFRAQSDNIEGTRRDNVGLASDLFRTRATTATTGVNANLSNLDNIYTNRFNALGTVFNTRTGSAEQLFKTNIGLASDLYGTGVNAATDFYRNNLNVAGNIFSTNASASTNAANLNATAETNRLDVMARARGAAAGTMTTAYQQDMLNNQQKDATSAALWSSVASTGASLGGQIFGSMYKTPTKNPYGFDNFDYGSGTGA